MLAGGLRVMRHDRRERRTYMGNSVIETMRVSPAASVIISMSLILFSEMKAP